MPPLRGHHQLSTISRTNRLVTTDLIEIGDFIATDNPERAVSFFTEIEARMIAVATRPESFPARAELHEGLRSARHGRYLIFFIEEEDEVRIVRVLHGARDLPRLLGD